MKVNSVPDVNAFVTIKRCYVHNQWYDISYVTLYVHAELYMHARNQ